MSLKNQPIARATMLIRRPIEDVFNAFIDPSITTKFWFSRSSGPLLPVGRPLHGIGIITASQVKYLSKPLKKTNASKLSGQRQLSGYSLQKTMD